MWTLGAPARIRLRITAIVVAVFLSAMLLFWLEPMFAKMVLPLLGGAPSVWNTAILFYQLLLLCGYGYAHFIGRLVRLPKPQVAVHLTIAVLPLLVLPIGLSPLAPNPTHDAPLSWLIGLLIATVGLPLFVLSTTSSLLQRWLSRAGRPLSRNPYPLFAASNLGALIGLLGYPLIIEPSLSIRNQSVLWSGIYVIYLLVLIGTALPLLKRARWGMPIRQYRGKSTVSSPAPRLRVLWVIWALLPSSLLLSVTRHLSSEVATIPMLWVLPLALYLVTFIIAFSPKPLIKESFFRRAFPIALCPLAAIMFARYDSPGATAVLLGLHLTVFALGAGLFHSKIFESRPESSHLSEFYLWITLGGALGSAFNVFVAPALFTTYFEYPLVLAIMALLMHSQPKRTFIARVSRVDVAGPLVIGAVLIIMLQGGNKLPWIVTFGLPAATCFLFSSHARSFGVSILLVLAAGTYHEANGTPLFVGRSFFGIHRVFMDESGRFNKLYHGYTLHGIQARSADQHDECLPLAYYHPNGPLGAIFKAMSPGPEAHIGVVGLGTGAIACYGPPGSQMDFHEIDPMVESIARSPELFSFLEHSRAKIKVILGDARISLNQVGDGTYDLLVLDAYSSDSIPIHLLTREAVALYLQKLSPGGLVAFHISSRHFKLGRVLATIAEALGLEYREWNDELVSPAEIASGRQVSHWAIMARQSSDLRQLATDSDWKRGEPESRFLWKDDYSSLFQIIAW